jgi:hypothetical protein
MAPTEEESMPPGMGGLRESQYGIQDSRTAQSEAAALTEYLRIRSDPQAGRTPSPAAGACVEWWYGLLRGDTRCLKRESTRLMFSIWNGTMSGKRQIETPGVEGPTI